jgi:protein-L-isoaspartate(D-aspartate) O-methyltransferase
VHREEELAIIRRAYAKQILFVARVADNRIEAAFANVRREDFLGPGPWLVSRWGEDYVPTPSADPVYVYTEHGVAIMPKRHLNNAGPPFHAMLIASADIKEGDHVVHIGSGTGYYTAIMSCLVGRSGRVTAVEVEPELAARTKLNLSSISNASVVLADGASIPIEAANVIYVNAGATRPTDSWLDALCEGGRLILPLTSQYGFLNNPLSLPIERRGAVFRIERRKAEYLARWISPVAIFPCEGARDPVSEAALAEAFEKGGWEKVTHLCRNNEFAEDCCWLRAPGWSLGWPHGPNVYMTSEDLPAPLWLPALRRNQTSSRCAHLY